MPIWAKPSGKRVAVAFSVAAAVPTFVYVCTFLVPGAYQSGASIGRFVDLLIFWMLAGLIVMIPATLIGFVLYKVAAPKVERDSIWLLLFCLLGGGFAAIPIDIWIGVEDVFGLKSNATKFSYADSGGDIYLDNKRTEYGWHRYIELTARNFAYGMLGGLIFWWIARPKRQTRPSIGAGSGISIPLSSDRS